MPVVVSVDLRHRFGPARNQGRRPTCMAFAASDAHAALRGEWEPLSCEYIFFKAQTRARKPPTMGSSLAAMLDALRLDGQPQEAGWPYLILPPADPANWQPPHSVGPLYGRDGKRADYALNPILATLDQGTPIILLSCLSSSFYMPTAEAVVAPAADELPDPNIRHALIAVGHGDWSGERVVLVRNSWGPSWGDEGYAWLTESFLAPRLFGAAILMENVDVSANSVAA
jgi:hypothetical protein